MCDSVSSTFKPCGTFNARACLLACLLSGTSEMRQNTAEPLERAVAFPLLRLLHVDLGVYVKAVLRGLSGVGQLVAL